jgi:hypothetical protein
MSSKSVSNISNKMANKYASFACLIDSDSENEISDKETTQVINNTVEDKLKNVIVINSDYKNTTELSTTEKWEKIKTEKHKTKHIKIKHDKPEKKEIVMEEPKLDIPKDDKVQNINVNINVDIYDHNIKFQNKWYIWVHEVDSKDWSVKSYKIAHVIETMKDFWEFFNSTYKLNQWKYNFFMMKANSHPTWEHSTNRHGGTCSIRIDISQSIDILEQLAILIVNESLTEEINDINGMSFAAKGNWCVVKIWNRDNKNNISNQMPSYLRKLYPAISIKYKENIPEY